jgi:E3 ubiquitin-protein ligase MARCH6
MADLAVAAPEIDAPDVMNDSQFVINSEAFDDGNADACRICRGEGSGSEPLFHPCKCSGSIKHVHQDCLMEWLSHSQKKHCELCKTPFRFTKLYSPNMPQSLPFPVLIRHVVVHIAKNLATWLRFALVALVWLACLPFTLRQVWRLLFWFSDGGWPSNYSRTQSIRNSTANQVLEVAREIHLASLRENGTSPVTPLEASQTTSASVGNLVQKLFGFLTPVSQTLNVSSSDPITGGLLKGLYYGFGIQSAAISDGITNETIAIDSFGTMRSHSHPSLLSDVSWLRNMTRNPYINDLFIAIVEGYIITVLVVVCFILVFLIREWVVQQQPGINMGAGFAPEAPAAERLRGQQALPEFRPPGNAEARRAPREEEQMVAPPEQRGERQIAPVRRRNVHFGHIDGENRPAALAMGNTIHPGNSNSEVQHLPALDDAASSSSQSRPIPSRDAFSPAVEIQRRLTEEPRMTEEFLAIWRRADSDPREVLRIIESENKTVELGYWVNAMKLLEDSDSNSEASPAHTSDGQSTGTKFPPFPVGGPGQLSVFAESLPRDSEGSSASSESWVDVSKPTGTSEADLRTEEYNSERIALETIANRALDKGKGRAEVDASFASSSLSHDHRSEEESTKTFFKKVLEENRPPQSPSDETSVAGPSRSRSRSDGPLREDSISTLANNNWSFSNLREESKTLESHRQGKIPYAPHDSEVAGSDTNMLTEAVLQKMSLSKAIAPPSHMSGSEAGEIAQDSMGLVAEDEEVQNYEDVEEAKAANPQEDEFDDDDDNNDGNDEGADNDDEYDGLPQLVPVDQLPERVAQPAEGPRFLGNVADFFWGDLGENAANAREPIEERIVPDIAAERDFVPIANHPEGLVEPEQDREVVEAAIAAGIDPNDQDAIDDAEDFEGIMELVGMRGPIFSLVQNALFSAFLLALAVAVGVWIPYNIGRISLLLVANPGPAFKLPLRMIFGFAAFLQDLTLGLLGLASHLFLALLSLPLYLWQYFVRGVHRPELLTNILTKSHLGTTAGRVSYDAIERVVNGTLDSLGNFSDSEIFAFSAASHEALISIQSLIVNTLAGIGAAIIFIFTGNWHLSMEGISWYLIRSAQHCWSGLRSLPDLIVKPDTWVISLDITERNSPLDLQLSVWDGWARFWAIFAGYSALCILGAMYVRKGSPFSSSQVGRDWEASILDLFNQAGGVMKVILIISIEMLVFPLYCGLLLDAALLPLFEKATVMSRINFIVESPFTSMFVHWFVGTCYMFHFALFVSMCRKIMRKGVLCK